MRNRNYLKVVTMCSSHFELPEDNWKYFKKFCNPSAVVTINYVTLCISVTLRLIFQNRVTFCLYLKHINYVQLYIVTPINI